jgi:hypothetical protein
MPGELNWDHALEDIPPAGLSVERAAEAEERQRIAAALDLVACSDLTVRYQIIPLAHGRYRLKGELAALIEQTCVVTLEPLEASIAESFAADYWPDETMPEPTAGPLAFDGEPPPEPIVGAKIDAGRIVFESVAAAIDPFPRRPGAVFEGPLSAPAGGKPESPFAVLANLKQKT